MRLLLLLLPLYSSSVLVGTRTHLGSEWADARPQSSENIIVAFARTCHIILDDQLKLLIKAFTTSSHHEEEEEEKKGNKKRRYCLGTS